MAQQETHKYDDIIHLSRPVSTRHARMSMLDRGAQFAPFAALVGFESVLEESARLTDAECFLEEDSKEQLNRKLRYIADHMDTVGEVTFLCYIPDRKKTGGSYQVFVGTVKKIDLYRRTIWLEDGREVDMDSVCSVEGNWEEE